MKFVLIGYMGSGKTVVGEQLGKALLFPFTDLDAEIEKEMNLSIPDIFEKKGEIFFRKKENEILKSVLEKKKDIILATGGGTPCYGSNMELLLSDKDIVVIYLKASPETLSERLYSDSAKRPLLCHLQGREAINDFVRKHLFERSYYYNQATVVIDTDGKSISEIVEAILVRLF